MLQDRLIELILLSASLLIDDFELVFLHLDATYIGDKVLYEALHLAIKVYIFVQVLRLCLAVAEVLRRLRQQTHRLRVRQHAKHRIQSLVEAIYDYLA